MTLPTTATVDANPIPTTVITIVRYVLTAIGGGLATFGVIDENTFNTIIGAAISIGSLAYGAYLAYRNRNLIVAAATSAPNTVVMVTR